MMLGLEARWDEAERANDARAESRSDRKRRRQCDKSEGAPHLHFHTGSRPLISDGPCNDVRGKPGRRPKKEEVPPLRRYEVCLQPFPHPPTPTTQPTAHSRADRVPCQQHPTPDLTGVKDQAGHQVSKSAPECGGVVWCRERRHTPVGMRARDPVYRGVMALTSGWLP